VDIQYPANQKSCNHSKSSGTIREGQTESPHLALSKQTGLANFGVVQSDNPERFSYPCAGCDREKTHGCKEDKTCQMFMLWRTMAVFE
jgi:hypothetical protein